LPTDCHVGLSSPDLELRPQFEEKEKERQGKNKLNKGQESEGEAGGLPQVYTERARRGSEREGEEGVSERERRGSV